MVNQVTPAMSVVGNALNKLAQMPGLSMEEKRAIVHSNISCEGKGEVRWWNGEKLFNLFQHVDIQPEEGTGEQAIPTYHQSSL